MKPVSSDATPAVPQSEGAKVKAFGNVASQLLQLPSGAQDGVIFSMLDEAHLVHGRPDPITVTAANVVRCSLLLDKSADFTGFDRVLMYCLAWTQARRY